jgi:hypothetical protein
MILKSSFARRLHRLTPIKTNPYSDSVTHLSGDTVSMGNRMKICINLRNLRMELRFLGWAHCAGISAALDSSFAKSDNQVRKT